jgi:HlyD family secretion protein
VKKRWILVIILLAAAVSLGVYGFSKRFKKGVEVKTAAVDTGELTSFFSTNGTVESKNKKEYYAQSVNKVTSVNIRIGSNIKKGDTLVTFETQDFSTQLKTAQKQYDNAKIQLDSLKKLKAKLDEQQKVPQVTPAPGSTPGTLTGSSMSMDDQIKMQQNQLEITKLNIESIKQNISKQQSSLNADFDGIVTAVNVKEGSSASPQMAAVVVEDISSLQVTVNANQYDVVNIKEGQEAVIHFNNKSFKGIVETINPVASKTISVSGTDTTVKVTVGILENDGTIKSGYDVDVDIKFAEKKDAVKIPAEAVVTDKNNKESVFIVENNIVRFREIATGLSSETEVEVTSGLKAGEKVILNPQPAIVEGLQVTEKGVE